MTKQQAAAIKVGDVLRTKRMGYEAKVLVSSRRGGKPVFVVKVTGKRPYTEEERSEVQVFSYRDLVVPLYGPSITTPLLG